jgi:hypothetical protein
VDHQGTAGLRCSLKINNQIIFKKIIFKFLIEFAMLAFIKLFSLIRFERHGQGHD